MTRPRPHRCPSVHLARLEAIGGARLPTRVVACKVPLSERQWGRQTHTDPRAVTCARCVELMTADERAARRK